ncbi:MAG TPA: autotransporter-associated beta strand repeat-containing protein [Luteolibacter sp.]|nr:autotransporter-associated beta strand repeat-containing protein [Luteolibacter sp.]
MKPKATLRSLLCLAGSSMMAASSAHALDGTWNVAAAGATSHNWTDTGMWASGQIATGADYTANFTGIDITGTKTVSLNGVNRTIGNITFTDATTSSNKLVISGNILTLDRTSGVPVINVTNQEIEITSTLAGNDGLVITGGGALRLNGTNNLTGGLTINAGALISQNGNRFGTNLITLGDVANTGALTSLQVTTAGPFSNDINVRGNGVNEIRNFSAGSTWSGAINLGGNLLFYDRQNGTTANVISGVISGTGNLTFQNRDDTVTNVLTLSNTNTFTGSTTITSGILSLTNLNSLQYSYIDTTASVAGDANDGLRTNQTTLKLGGLSGNKNLASIFTTTSGGYSSVTAITLDVATANNLTYSGVIDGARNLTKTGLGTQVLSGTNGYTGTTTVSNGTLLTTKAAALPGYNAASRVSVASGATLAVNVDSGGWTSGEIDTLLGATPAAFSSGSKLGIDVTTGSFTYSNDIGTTQAAKGLVKSGAGTLVLDTTHTYTGATTVSAGTLNVSGSGSINTSSSITVASGGTLRYNSSVALTRAPTLNGVDVNNRAVLGGTGTINVAVTLDNVGDTLSPGNSPGVQNYGVGQTWSSFSLDWELNDWTAATAGTNIDQIGITGVLDLSAIAANSYVLNILSLTNGNASGLVGASGGNTFTETNNSWTILTATSITGFDAGEWSINAGGFTDVEGGTWSISQVGNSLQLNYAAIPEPGVAMLGGLSLLGLFLRRRRQ